MNRMMNGIRRKLAIGSIFGKQRFRSISQDDLRKERVRLEQSERALVEEIERIEVDKKKLFDRGTGEKSQRLQLITARKIWFLC